MSDVTDGIRDYLASGGLFNPELMDHERVRDLLIESRDEIERLRADLFTAACQAEEESGKALEKINRLRDVMRRVAGELGRENEGLAQMIREALGE